jgi:outer membrane protein TolC
MRKIYLLLVFLSSVGFAQRVDYNKVIPAERQGMEFQEKLVALAWKNYPANEVPAHKIEIAEKNVSMAKWSWTDNFRLFYNFNDRMLAQDGKGYTQPTYGVGVALNVGSILSLPQKIQVAKENLRISELDQKTQKHEIRREVISRYQKYLLSINLLKIRTQSYEDTYSTYLLITERFKKGEVTLEEYNESLTMYTRSMEAKAVSETEILIAKAAVEELIGVPLEDVK